MTSPVLLVPHYNHAEQFAGVIEVLAELGLPLLVVDDGSDDLQWRKLRSLCDGHDWVRVERLEPNQGKGAAVLFGIQVAGRSGYTHALQFDADGQHDSKDIPQMLQIAASHPHAIVSGLPQFGDDIPPARKWGRRFGDLWCRIETLSGAIKDAMCGFRVYPVEQTIALDQRYYIAPRMGFDIDILVKAYWSGMEIHYLPTRVRYPEGGVSHFRYFKDNVAITWMHTKLVLGMLWRSPQLIARHFRR